MRDRRLRVFLQSIGLLLAAGFQISFNFWSLLFKQRIELLLFDRTTWWIATLETVLGLMSGFLIAMSLFPYLIQKTESKIPGIIVLLSLLLPISALTIKGMAIATGFRWFQIRFMPVWNWAVYSEAPALWLGLTLAALILTFFGKGERSV